jgi:excisionase family DNA binding protein
MKITGKTRTEIERALRDKDRPELLDLIYKLATMEPYFTVSEVARARKVSRDTILDKIRKREIPRAHRLGDHGLRIPLSSIAQWDANTEISNSDSQTSQTGTL